MRILLLAGLFATAATSASSDDIALMVGLRNAMAVAIRDFGYRCPEVLDYQALEFQGDGRVLKVMCTSPGHAPGATIAFRVIAYPEGDFTARPWRDDAAHLR
jgi:hypothetical protein